MLELISFCLNGAIKSKNICALDSKNPPMVRYYEAGKSCYVNGTFYSKCEDRLNAI
jgi:hypothetical protein